MSRLPARCLPLVLLAALGSCTRFGIFEDVGFEPHPPAIELIGIAYQPPPEEEAPPTPTPTAATPDAATAVPPDFRPPEGFEIRVNDAAQTVLVLRVRYQDAGADIVKFMLRDRDSQLMIEFVPKESSIDLDGDGIPDLETGSEFVIGTAGIVDLPDINFSPSMLGPHRLEIWAVDSHESRSDKIAFTVRAVLGTP